MVVSNLSLFKKWFKIFISWFLCYILHHNFIQLGWNTKNTLSYLVCLHFEKQRYFPSCFRGLERDMHVGTACSTSFQFPIYMGPHYLASHRQIILLSVRNQCQTFSITNCTVNFSATFLNEWVYCQSFSLQMHQRQHSPHAKLI